MIKNPLISAIVTNYNYGGYIGEAIESVLNQTYNNLEIIIINDGSTDDSDTVIEGYVKNNPNLRYINQDNSGANVSRNKGIDRAKGEYVFLLDADNWLNSDHIEALYNSLTEKKADIVYTNLSHFGGDNEMQVVPEFDIDILKVTNFIDTSALMRKNSIGKNRFDLWLNRKSSQDWDFFLGLALKGVKIVKAPDSVFLNYRVHDKQHGNSFKTVEKIRQSMEVYDYIIKKYYKKYPEQFSAQIKWTNGLVTEYSYVKRLNLELQQKLEEIEYKYSIVANSKSYAIGRAVTAPWRVIKERLGRVKNS